MMQTILRTVGRAGFAAFCVAALVGCATYPTASMPVAPPPPTTLESAGPPTAGRADYQENSLWQASNGLSGLFLDTKARNVGDIVTIQIAESSKATNKANTETGRDSSLSAGIDSLFGIENWWQDTVLRKLGTDMPKVNPFGAASVSGSMKSDFKGDGTTSRSGDLTAFITCRVTEVLPNGNLRIVGTREILVNHENQVIILSGVIRPRDINDQNVIASRFVADAKIAYSGSGIIDDRQRPGWLANILDVVWPF
jgi:flagellar L-ring protein precursor FlgH